MSRWVTDELNADSPQGRRERLRLYREMVSAIAFNDEPLDTSLESVSGFTTVVLAADVFGKTPKQVAAAVIRKRREAARADG